VAKVNYFCSAASPSYLNGSSWLVSRPSWKAAGILVKGLKSQPKAEVDDLSLFDLNVQKHDITIQMAIDSHRSSAPANESGPSLKRH